MLAFLIKFMFVAAGLGLIVSGAKMASCSYGWIEILLGVSAVAFGVLAIYIGWNGRAGLDALRQLEF